MVAIGIVMICIGGSMYQIRYAPKRLTISSYKPTQKISSLKISTITEKKSPQYIEIPDIGVRLPIIPSEIKNGTWETTSKGVSYLTSSPIPGNTGNSILYGHNWTNLLGSLTRVKPGTQIIITYADGSKNNFTVEYTGTVKPDQIGILNQTNDVRITIYTCTGFLDSQRFIAVAFPSERHLTKE